MLIVTFWASWCGPCRKEISVMENLQHSVGHDALDVVAVNFNEDDDTWHAMQRRLQSLEIKITHDTSRGVTKAYDVTAVPHMFMIDKDGRVAIVHRGYDESSLDGFVDEINKLLVQPPAQAAGKSP